MSDYKKIKGRPKFLKDNYSKAIIINDPGGLERAKAIKERLNSKEQEIEELKKSVDDLKNLVYSLMGEKDGADSSQ